MQRTKRLSAALLLGVALGCASPLPELSLNHERIVVGNNETDRLLPPVHWATVRTIRAALTEGADEKARILTQRLERDGGGGVDDLVAGFRRVLDGRELVRSLKLEMRVELPREADAASDERVLILTARQDLTSQVRLRLPVGHLEHTVLSLAPTGLETRELDSRVTHRLGNLLLAPGQSREIELMRYHLPLRGSIGVRERWTLDFGDGHLEWDGHQLPAASVAATPLRRDELPPEISSEPVEPAKLVEYFQRPRIFMPLLLEHAVRIEPSRREETIRLLLPVLERLAVENPRRGRMLAPTLRWLTHSTQPGIEPDAWVAALQEHLLPPSPPNLDLPNR